MKSAKCDIILIFIRIKKKKELHRKKGATPREKERLFEVLTKNEKTYIYFLYITNKAIQCFWFQSKQGASVTIGNVGTKDAQVRKGIMPFFSSLPRPPSEYSKVHWYMTISSVWCFIVILEKQHLKNCRSVLYPLYIVWNSFYLFSVNY